MKLNTIFELSMILDTDHFQKIFDMAYNKTGYLKEVDDEYLDTSFMEKGITVIYRDSQYKKRIRLLMEPLIKALIKHNCNGQKREKAK